MNLPHNVLLVFAEDNVKYFYVPFLDPNDFEDHLNEHQIFWCLIYLLDSYFWKEVFL